jgi:trigger factor
MQLSQMGLDQTAIEAKLKGWGDDMFEKATRQVKASLLLGAISKKENIQASEEELRQEVVRMAMQSQRKPQEVIEDLQKKGLLGGLFRQLTELKTLSWVMDKSTERANG